VHRVLPGHWVRQEIRDLRVPQDYPVTRVCPESLERLENLVKKEAQVLWEKSECMAQKETKAIRVTAVVVVSVADVECMETQEEKVQEVTLA